MLSSYLCPKMYLYAKRASKIKVLPKEMLLSFSIGTFFTNFDITNRELHSNILHCTKANKMREKYSNGDYFFFLSLSLSHSLLSQFYLGLMLSIRAKKYLQKEDQKPTKPVNKSSLYFKTQLLNTYCK